MNAPGNARLRYLNSISVFHAASIGDLRRLRSMLQTNPKLVNTRSLNDGGTPLLAAAQSGQLEAVHCCLEYGADPEARNDRGLTALHLACKKVVHDMTAEEGMQDEQAAEPSPTLDNHEASRNNSTTQDLEESVTRQLLRQWRLHGIPHDVDSRDGDGRTALHHAAATRNVEAVRALLAAGADFLLADLDGHAPLDLAMAAMAHDCASLLTAAEKVYLLHRARHLHEAEEWKRRRGGGKGRRRSSNGNVPSAEALMEHGGEEGGKHGELEAAVVGFVVCELNGDLFRELRDGLELHRDEP